jgi:uncharacterized glyoxalase superfamily protein PhnB
MKPTPPGWPRVSPSLYYADPKAAIEWLCRAFGFRVRLLVEGDDGSVEHSELEFGDGLVMVSGSGGSKAEKYPYRKAPGELGGLCTQSLMVLVDDVEAHFRQACEAGAKVIRSPETHDYGEEYWSDRIYECEDIGGHHWWFCQRLRQGKASS